MTLQFNDGTGNGNAECKKEKTTQAFNIRALQSIYDIIHFLQFSLLNRADISSWIDEAETQQYLNDLSLRLQSLNAENAGISQLLQQMPILRAPFESLMALPLFQRHFPGLYFTLHQVLNEQAASFSENDDILKDNDDALKDSVLKGNEQFAPAFNCLFSQVKQNSNLLFSSKFASNPTASTKIGYSTERS